jgi:hypothetical protein
MEGKKTLTPLRDESNQAKLFKKYIESKQESEIAQDIVSLTQQKYLTIQGKGVSEAETKTRREAGKTLNLSPQYSVERTQREMEMYGALKAWNHAMGLLNKDALTREEATDIARVIHGHTWVEEVEGGTTPTLIQEVSSTIQQHCPSISIVLNQLLEGM